MACCTLFSSFASQISKGKKNEINVHSIISVKGSFAITLSWLLIHKDGFTDLRLIRVRDQVQILNLLRELILSLAPFLSIKRKAAATYFLILSQDHDIETRG